MSRRHGVTLIELLVVMTILSLVWLSITSVLYSLYRADHRLRDDLQREHALDRCAMRLRLDAHAASSVNLVEQEDGTTELVLASDDERSIHYGEAEQGVYRVVLRAETVLHQDIFLTGNANSEWTLQRADDATLVTLTMTSESKGSAMSRVRRIKTGVAPITIDVAKQTEVP